MKTVIAINKHVGEECPRCCVSILEDDGAGHAICSNEFDEDLQYCGFSTEGLEDEDNQVIEGGDSYLSLMVIFMLTVAAVATVSVFAMLISTVAPVFIIIGTILIILCSLMVALVATVS